MQEIEVEILEHIRKVQLSAKQRPVYFEWNGLSIKGKKSKIPRKFFKDSRGTQPDIIIEDLKDNLVIGVFKDAKLQLTIRSTTHLPSAASLITDDRKYRLCISDTDEFGERFTPVICNPKIVNTPRMYLIKGQDFYNSKIKEFQRGVIMQAIKNCFKPFMVSMPVIDSYPVRIECQIHDTIKNFYDNTNIANGLGAPWDLDNYAYPYMKAFPDVLQELGKIKNDDRLHITQPPSPIFVPIEDHKDRKLVFIIRKDEREIIAENEIYKSYHKNKETEDKDLIKEDEHPFKDEPLTFDELNTPFNI